MKRMFDISRYPGIAVFVLAGLSIVIVTFASYNLVQQGMANLRYIGEFGWLALQTGALVQLLQLLAYGAVALHPVQDLRIRTGDPLSQLERQVARRFAFPSPRISD